MPLNHDFNIASNQPPLSTHIKEQSICEDIVFKQLFQEHSEKLFQFLYLKFRSKEFAQEGMQEAFIALWRNCKKVSYSKSKNYIFTVGKNKVIDIIRQKNKHLSLTNEINIADDQTEEGLDTSNRNKQMEYILSQLPKASQEAFLMNRLQGLKYAEIARELNISVKAVEKRMTIALSIIREELQNLK